MYIWPFFFLLVFVQRPSYVQPVLWPIGQETARLRERVTLGLTKIRTADPHPMIEVETQFIASQPFPVSVLGLIPSPSAAPVPCWCGKCQHQVMETQIVREYPHQLGCQTLHYKTLPRISPMDHHIVLTKPIAFKAIVYSFCEDIAAHT